MSHKDMNPNIPRLDLYFSYWILAWFFLYYFHIIPYNPKLFIIFALSVNVTAICIEIYMKQRPDFIFLEIFIIAIMKGIPLSILWKTSTKKTDIMFGIQLYLIYLLYLFVLKGTIGGIIQNVEDTLKRISEHKPTTPIIMWMFPSTQ